MNFNYKFNSPMRVLLGRLDFVHKGISISLYRFINALSK